VHYTPYY